MHRLKSGIEIRGQNQYLDAKSHVEVSLTLDYRPCYRLLRICLSTLWEYQWSWISSWWLASTKRCWSLFLNQVRMPSWGGDLVKFSVLNFFPRKVKQLLVSFFWIFCSIGTIIHNLSYFKAKMTKKCHIMHESSFQWEMNSTFFQILDLRLVILLSFAVALRFLYKQLGWDLSKR